MTEDTLSDDFKNAAINGAKDEADLGFGSVVAGASRQRLLNADGSFNVQRTGVSLFTSLNLYHTFLAMSWSTLSEIEKV